MKNDLSFSVAQKSGDEASTFEDAFVNSLSEDDLNRYCEAISLESKLYFNLSDGSYCNLQSEDTYERN